MARSKSEYASALDATPSVSLTGFAFGELCPVGDYFQAKMLAAPKPNGDTSHINLRLLPPFTTPESRRLNLVRSGFPLKHFTCARRKLFADFPALLRFGGCHLPNNGASTPLADCSNCGGCRKFELELCLEVAYRCRSPQLHIA